MHANAKIIGDDQCGIASRREGDAAWWTKPSRAGFVCAHGQLAGNDRADRHVAGSEKRHLTLTGLNKDARATAGVLVKDVADAIQRPRLERTHVLGGHAELRILFWRQLVVHWVRRRRVRGL